MDYSMINCFPNRDQFESICMMRFHSKLIPIQFPNLPFHMNIDGVAQLEADPSQWNFTISQNPPNYSPPLYIAATSKTIMQF